MAGVRGGFDINRSPAKPHIVRGANGVKASVGPVSLANAEALREAAEDAAAAAEEALTQVEVISGLTGEDAAMAAIAADPGSDFAAQQRVAIDAAIADSEQMADAVAEALADTSIVTVDSTGYDIVLVLGQSNAAGRGTYDANLDPTNSRVMQFGAASADNYPTVISLAKDPLSHRESFAGSGKTTAVGPIMEFARWYDTTLRPNRRLLIVPASYGGTPLSSNATLSWRVGVSGGLLSLAMTQAQAALAAAGTNARIVAAFWLQGETDGDSSISGATYQADLDALIDSVRTTLGIPSLPFIIGQMVPDYLGTGTRAAIDAVHADTPNRKSMTAYVTGLAGANLGDGNHYNAIGARYMGKQWYDAFVAAIGGQPPAQPGTPTITSIAASTALLTWTVAARAAVYRIEASTDGGSTWTNVGESYSNTGTASGLTPNTTGYKFRIVATNLLGDSTPSGTVTGNTGVARLLDTISSTARLHVAGAYSENRLLSASYAGPALRVRRSSDNTEMDIGFVSGVVDTATMLTFGGVGDVFITKVYDQSGAGKHRVQATTSAQRKIVSAGVLVATSGITLPVYDGTAMYESVAGGLGLYAAGAATMCAVVKGASQTNKRFMAEGNTANASGQYALGATGTTSGAHQGTYIKNQANGSVSETEGSATVFDSAIHQIAQTDSGTSIQRYLDGSTDGSAVTYSRSGTLAPDVAAFGALVRTSAAAFYAGALPEVVLFNSALSGTDLTTIKASQKTYYGTP